MLTIDSRFCLGILLRNPPDGTEGSSDASQDITKDKEGGSMNVKLLLSLDGLHVAFEVPLHTSIKDFMKFYSQLEHSGVVA